MSETITDCLYVKIGSLTQAIIFFRDFLGMEVELLDQTTCIASKPDDGMTIVLSEETCPSQTNQIQINTEDCIEQYCLLKSKGVLFKQAPTYFTEGLMAEFTDGFGNHFFLLESRMYNE
ncbi:hypothetical protein [Pedobacter sp. UBA4863]|uniref:hypothetical protein n=1 Tax=Pedobacter sp. UBA4863 TaxID=1947060 RepID=UPI0025CE1EF2|nr:hypothetical protein [Pedobacter sp. UBA4863]